jgi:hypothetical protein
MVGKIALSTGGGLIVAAAFIFTLSVIDNGLTTSLLALLHFLNP